MTGERSGTQKRIAGTSSSESDKDANNPKRIFLHKSELPAAAKQRRLAAQLDPPLRLSAALLADDYVAAFRTAWQVPDDGIQNEHTTEHAVPAAGIRLHKQPFTLAVCANLLQDAAQIGALADELVHQNFTRKHNDLYSFHQTIELAAILSPRMREFNALLRGPLLRHMELLTGQRLTHVSASCAMYTAGDHLLMHDDRLTDRRIAYVFYLSPWPGVERWTAQMGGALEQFAVSEADGRPQQPAVRCVMPANNQFVFFRVGERSFHQVAEVETLDYPRFSINGWFHGPPEVEAREKAANRSAVEPKGGGGKKREEKREKEEDAEEGPRDGVDEQASMQRWRLEKWIRGSYLSKATKRDVQKDIEEHSERSLDGFFLPAFYAAVCEQLRQLDADRWELAGPADRRHYERLVGGGRGTEDDGPLGELVALMRSPAFFRLLFEYTELDLAGDNAAKPRCSLNVWRVGRQSYSMMDDKSAAETDTLDVIVYFNVGNSVAGKVQYLNPEDEEVEEDEEEYEEDEGVVAENDDEEEGDEADEEGESKPKPSTSKSRMAATTAWVEEDVDEPEVMALTSNTVATASPSTSSEDGDQNSDEGMAASESIGVDFAPNTKRPAVKSSVLLDLEPTANSLNMVFRCQGTSKFLNYVSRRQLAAGEYVYMLVAAYRE